MTVETTALLAQLLPALEAAVTKGHLGYSVTVVVKDGPVEVAASLPSAGWYGERSVWRSVRIDRAQIAKELFNAAQSARETLARAIRSVQP